MWVKNQPVYCSQISGGGYEEGTQAYASRMWGVTPEEYMRIADPWPMNPDGELLFGLKIENPRADANVETSVRVPGIAFAEWGPGDHGFYILGRPGIYKDGGEVSPQMAAVRRRVLNATKAAGVRFLNACNENNVLDLLKEGVMICTGGDTPAADKGRAFTKAYRPLVMHGKFFTDNADFPAFVLLPCVFCGLAETRLFAPGMPFGNTGAFVKQTGGGY